MSITGEQIKARFENYLDDSLDSDFTYEIMTDAYDEIRSETNWSFLRKLDQSGSVSSSNLYTDSHDLPSGLLTIIAITVGTNTEPLKQIAFEDRENYKDVWGYFYIDFANSKYYICGKPNETSTINFWYIEETGELNSTSVITPRKIGVAIAYKMVEIYYNIEFDDVSMNLRVPERYIKLYEKTLGQLKLWDASLRIKAIENKANTEV